MGRQQRPPPTPQKRKKKRKKLHRILKKFKETNILRKVKCYEEQSTEAVISQALKTRLKK